MKKITNFFIIGILIVVMSHFLYAATTEDNSPNFETQDMPNVPQFNSDSFSLRGAMLADNYCTACANCTPSSKCIDSKSPNCCWTSTYQCSTKSVSCSRYTNQADCGTCGCTWGSVDSVMVCH
jgi:hypothetical protein